MMQSDHRNILRDKNDYISKAISLEDISNLLYEYKIFNKYMWLNIKSMSDVLNMLTSRGPKAFDNFVEILCKAGYKNVSDSLVKSYFTLKLSKDMIYKVSQERMGKCLIINNVKFVKNEEHISGEDDEDRHGSDVDAQSLKDFFQRINYEVIDKRNLKANEMYDCIKHFSQSNFKLVDVSIVIILSHGTRIKNRDVVFGTDKCHIYKTDIYDLFNNRDCTQLQGKPKIFIFVACRGRGKDYGTPNDLFQNESLDSSEIATLTTALSDIYIVHSSLPGHVSVREHDKGSWFCQDLVSVLDEFYLTYDIEFIMKLVSDKVMKRVSNLYGVKQTPQIEIIGFNKYLFLRGYHSD